MLQDKIKNVLAGLEEQLQGLDKKKRLNVSVLASDRDLRENADETREAVQGYLDDKHPSYDNTVRVDGHNRIEIEMRLKQE